MIKDFDKLLLNYAKLIVNRGLNLKKDRIINIYADIDQPDFVNLLVEECYKAGARLVKVIWNCAPIERLIYQKTSLAELNKLYSYKKAQIKFNIKHDVSNIYLESNDPNYLNGVDSKKVSEPGRIVRKYADAVRGLAYRTAPYTIACVPSVAWAKVLFPELCDIKAVEKLWSLIFMICHVTKDDPYRAWDEHCYFIDKRAKWLNSLDIKTLNYKSKNGTDLTVGMTNKYQFEATADYDVRTGRIYYSNIPTEECFVSPHRLKTNGIVYASKPLCVNGQLIEDIVLKFKNGRIIFADAKKNKKLLLELIEADEGSHYLGEAALVPFDSLINNTGILFLNTLYDENACCHFALGSAYTFTYRDYEKLKKSELKAAGINFSSIHEDFMIGTKDLSIVATTRKGKKIPIFVNGVWAK